MEAYDRICHTLLLRGEAGVMVTALAEAGVRALVLKGCAVAGDLVPLEARPVGDVDLLVRRKDWRRAAAVLEARGARPYRPSHRWLATRLHHAGCYVTERGVALDVHAALADPMRWRVDVDGLFGRAQRFDLGGRAAYRLCAEDLVLHVAINQAKDDYVVDRSAARDLEGVIAELEPAWRQVVERAHRWRCAVALYLTLENARRLRSVRVPDWVLRAVKPQPARLRALEAMLDLGRARPYRYPRHPRRLRQLLVAPLCTDDLRFFPRRSTAHALVGLADLALLPATVAARGCKRALDRP